MTAARPTLNIPAEHRAAVREWLEALAAERWALAQDAWDDDDLDEGDAIDSEANVLHDTAELLAPEDEVRS